MGYTLTARSRTAAASARSQWASPDLNRKRQITVGTAGPQHTTHNHTTHPETHNTQYAANKKAKPQYTGTNRQATNAIAHNHKHNHQHNHKHTATITNHKHSHKHTITITNTQPLPLPQTHNRNTQPQHATTNTETTSTTTNTQPQHSNTTTNTQRPQYNYLCVWHFAWQVVTGCQLETLATPRTFPNTKIAIPAQARISKTQHHKTHFHGNVLLTMARSQMIEMSSRGSLEVKQFCI